MGKSTMLIYMWGGFHWTQSQKMSLNVPSGSTNFTRKRMSCRKNTVWLVVSLAPHWARPAAPGPCSTGCFGSVFYSFPSVYYYCSCSTLGQLSPFALQFSCALQPRLVFAGWSARQRLTGAQAMETKRASWITMPKLAKSPTRTAELQKHQQLVPQGSRTTTSSFQQSKRVTPNWTKTLAAVHVKECESSNWKTACNNLEEKKKRTNETLEWTCALMLPSSFEKLTFFDKDAVDH